MGFEPNVVSSLFRARPKGFTFWILIAWLIEADPNLQGRLMGPEPDVEMIMDMGDLTPIEIILGGIAKSDLA